MMAVARLVMMMMLFVLLSEDISTVYIGTGHFYFDLYCYLFNVYSLNSGYSSCSLDGLMKQNTVGIFPHLLTVGSQVPFS
jgi:hypothetical protein